MANQKTRQRTRQEFRKRLRSWGMKEEDIDLCAKQMKQRQLDKELGRLPKDAPVCTLAVYVKYLRLNTPVGSHKDVKALNFGNDYEAPSDSGYKPSVVDSVLRGAARATGETAKAVKRRKTITKHEYEQRSNHETS